MSLLRSPADARQALGEQDGVQPRMQASVSEILGNTTQNGGPGSKLPLCYLRQVSWLSLPGI